MAQTLQSVACNAAHSLEALFRRGLLRMHDLIGQDTLPLIRDVLAQAVGLQRSGVRTVAGKPQNAGFIC